ncbi:cation diffusion facilitator family transporter [Anaerococcus tetradius]|uniref:Cation diffusion facilitator family transporter n=1 Tax=Anaerococcus tetradius TaxID=33036 RepID=A0A133KHB2_9FIRM|nr:cation diffusion facilitator family transporter [Anaerococcus tetradius]KWZ78952.1 cation diffusion facilitator family transporter [Anaerococcus tetradius]
MFEFLSKKFIKASAKKDEFTYRLSIISLSSSIGIAINILLFAMKAGIGFVIHSQAIVNDAFNNLSDSVVSLMALLGSNISKKPADKEHPFGHGRGEYVISLLVSIIIMYVGFMLFINSVKSFGEERFEGLTMLSLGILLVSNAVKVYIYLLNKSLYKKFDSELNLGVMLDARNDILATSAIIIGDFIQNFLSFNVDALMGIVISFFVFHPGLEMFKDTIAILLGKRIDIDIEKEIDEIIMSCDLIKGYHDMQIHEYGKGRMAGSVHVEVPSNLTVEVVHKAIDKVEKEITKKTGVEITLHMDPTYCVVEDN